MTITGVLPGRPLPECAAAHDGHLEHAEVQPPVLIVTSPPLVIGLPPSSLPTILNTSPQAR